MMKRFLVLLAAALLLAACHKDTPGGGGGGGEETATMYGCVTSVTGSPIEGVVVSDGLNCCKTKYDGSFALTADLESARYIFVSTPSEYSAPRDSTNRGIPVYYKQITHLTKSSDGTYRDINFKLTPISNPSHCTVLMYADPQPRKHYSTKNNHDNIAYGSLDCMDDMFADLADKAATISDGQVYGICLGDLVHENMTLYNEYVAGATSTGFVTYNAIGNHDYNKTATNADAGAGYFESWFGPRNYSFNLAGVHWVVLENILMNYEGGKVTGYEYGLSDRTMTWLTNDLEMVDRSTTVCVCSHGQMFYNYSKDYSASAKNGAAYKAVLSRFEHVYSWAGHSHQTFNRAVSGETIESHTLTRTTGELWTNEHMGANGTPRGYLAITVDNGSLKWIFHPISRQKGKFCTSTTQPAYTYRDWDCVDGVCLMKSDGSRLDERYQMHAYKPLTYGTGDKNVYVNIFMWDEQWKAVGGLPRISINGGSPKNMAQVGVSNANAYDYSFREMREHYMKTGFDSEYTFPSGSLYSLFSAYVGNEKGTATITVTDRFGNNFETTITL